MHFASRDPILLMRRFFCSVKKFPLNGPLNTFHISVKNAVVEGLQSYLHSNELDAPESKAIGSGVSVEFALLFLEVFEESFPFCSENVAFVSELFAKIFANVSNCSVFLVISGFLGELLRV